MSLESEIEKLYKEYAELMDGEITEQFKQLIELDALQRKKLAKGVITVKEYKRWLKTEIINSQTYRELLDKLADDISALNDRCIDIIEEHTTDEYIKGAVAGLAMLGAGVVGTTVTKQKQQALASMGLQVTLKAVTPEMFEATKATPMKAFYNKDNIEDIIKRMPRLLPKPSEATLRRIRRERLKIWNRQVLNSQILTGIRKGESIPKIAKRLQTAVGMDETASLRNARTAVGAVRNRAEQDIAEKAQKAGINIKKVWLATLDNRTRDSHRHMDGVQVFPDEKFDVNGSKMMFPKDPEGAPAEVYNCRCTMIYNVDGKITSLDPKDISRVSAVEDYDAWKSNRKK